jgi:outer membrane protein assembly factor BamE (lipoprotein component of BamABCDE complex)
MNTSIKVILSSLAVAALAGACAHSRNLHSTREREMTMGIVQKEIHVGMPSPEVVEALGSPNMVRRDSSGKETWVYDKIATEASYSNSSSNVGGSVAGAGMPGDVLLLGTIGGNHGRNRGASATTQKTLTVIIHFDLDDKVETFSYHSSTF